MHGCASKRGSPCPHAAGRNLPLTSLPTCAANVPEVITVAASNLPTKYNGSKAGDPEDIYKVGAGQRW